MTLDEVLNRQGRKSGWVAEQLGVSSATVSLWRSGKREIPQERMRQLAELLGVEGLTEGSTRQPQAIDSAPARRYGQPPDVKKRRKAVA